MAYFQLAQPYQQTQADPYGAFVQGQQQGNQLAAQRMALQQAQQAQAQQNQLNTLAPQIYTTTDPTAQQQLQGQLAAQGPEGQKAALNAQDLWAAKSSAQKQALATGADQAARYALTASQTSDVIQQQTLLDQAYQAMLATGADPAHIQALKQLDTPTQIKAITAGAMTIKDLYSQDNPDLSKVVNLNVPGGTQQMVAVGGRYVPVGAYAGGTTPNAQPTPAAPTAAQPTTGTIQNFNANFVKPYDQNRIGSIIQQVNAPSQYDPIIQQAAQAAGIDPRMLKAQLIAESGLNPNAGNSQSVGIAEFTPATAQQMGIDPRNPQQSIMAAAKLLAQNGGQTAQGFGNYYGGANQAQHGPNTQQYVANMQAVQSALQGTPAQTPQTASQTAPQQASGLSTDQLGQVQQKFIALQQQAGHALTVGQLMQATGASPQMTQAVVQASGLNPNLPIDVRNPDAAQALFQGMIAASQQAPHLVPNQMPQGPSVPSNGVTSPQVATPQPAAPIAAPAPAIATPIGFKPNASVRVMTPDEIKNAGLPTGTVAQIKPDGTISVINKSDNTVEAQTPGDPSLNGPAYVASLPDNIRGNALLIAEGKAPFPTGYVMKTAYGQQLVAAATKINPDLDATTFKTRQAANVSAGSGPLGTSTNAFNTAIEHANALIDANQKMGVSNLPGIGMVDAKLLQLERNNAYNTFIAGRQPFASEMARAYKGGAPAEGEIDKYYDDLDPAQGQKAIAQKLQTYTTFLYDKALANARQFQQAMRQSGIAYAPIPPETMAAIQKSRALAIKAGVDPSSLDDGSDINQVTGTPAIGTQSPAGWSIQKVQ